jgi:hypothetical protein
MQGFFTALFASLWLGMLPGCPHAIAGQPDELETAAKQGRIDQVRAFLKTDPTRA